MSKYEDVKSPKYRVCDDKPRHCKSFNTLKDLVEWAQEEFKKETLNIGDKVKVIDTGKCYSYVSKEDFYNFYISSPYDIGEALEIASNINHSCLGYLDGIKSLPDDEFEVAALFKSARKNIDFILLQPCNCFKYHGYYIISKEGVEKWQ